MHLYNDFCDVTFFTLLLIFSNNQGTFMPIYGTIYTLSREACQPERYVLWYARIGIRYHAKQEIHDRY